MRRVVVRYDADKSVLPKVVEVGADGLVPDFPPGWSIDESADPVEVEAAIVEARANAAAAQAPIRFASAATPDAAVSAAPSPSSNTTVPAEPATTEGN